MASVRALRWSSTATSSDRMTLTAMLTALLWSSCLEVSRSKWEEARVALPLTQQAPGEPPAHPTPQHLTQVEDKPTRRERSLSDEDGSDQAMSGNVSLSDEGGATSGSTSRSFFARDPILPDDYIKEQRPGIASGAPIEVGVAMWLLAVQEVDEHSQMVVLETDLMMEWHEDRVLIPAEMTDPESYIVLQSSVLSTLWYPDVTVSRLRSVSTPTLITKAMQIYVKQNSTVRLIWRVTMGVGCKMNFQPYPFDHQRCHIQIESYTYQVSDLILYWLDIGQNGLYIADDIHLENFAVQFVPNNASIQIYGTESYPSVAFDLHLSRQLSSYVIQTFLPQMMFVLISWCSFFVPPEMVPGRMTLCITTVLTISTMYAAVRTGTPASSYFKAIELFGIINVFYVFAVLLHYTNILRILSSHQQTKKITVVEHRSASLTTRSRGCCRSRKKTEPWQVRPAFPGGGRLTESWTTSRGGASTETFAAVAARLDNLAKIFFPLSYFLVQLAYWVYYTF
ncbi:glycine receptor subunit alpha-2-like isoform X2 [Panulirus ornatus]|uniref:glycine receptor subunit alpha-2-like isoform X2 n=1 Tax=Panulirus ornatus TaxID=150431 RepID=UPI003A896150